MKKLTIGLLAFLFSTILLISTKALAQGENPYQDIGNYRINYSVFNSSFLSQEAASAYGFVRGSDKAIINIAITEKDAGGLSRGLPVELKGSASNLLQQITEFNFVEINEEDATYYLAEFKFADQEPMNYSIHVLLPGERYSDTITFAKTLYHD